MKGFDLTVRTGKRRVRAVSLHSEQVCALLRTGKMAVADRREKKPPRRPFEALEYSDVSMISNEVQNVRVRIAS